MRKDFEFPVGSVPELPEVVPIRRHVVVIHNPNAGRGRRRHRLHTVVEALQRAGLAGAVRVAPNVWHLVAGLEAEQYAEGIRRRVASA